MGSVLQNSAASNLTAVSAGGAPNFTLTQIGWAIGAGLKLNLPMIAAGDTLYLTAAYANGDLDHIMGSNTSGSPPNVGRELGGLWRVDRNMYVTPSAAMGVGACAAAATLNSSCFRTEQTTGWSIGGVFTHYWTPTLRSNLLASYLQLNPGSQTRNTDWLFGGVSNASVIRIGGQLVWSPTKDLDIGAEVQYMALNQKLASFNGFGPNCTVGGITPPGACPAAYANIINSPSSNAWQARLRVQRQF
jgi:hypothetical protein